MSSLLGSPILRALTDATNGHFPDVDGGVTFVPAFGAPDGTSTLEVVMAFTGHAFVATSADPALVLAAGADGYGMASSPAVLSLLGGIGAAAGEQSSFGVTDATMFARGTGAPAGAHGSGAPAGASGLTARTDLEGHHRVRHARRIRRDVVVYGDERGLVTLGTGFAGRRELSVEAVPQGQGRGWGRSLITDALALVPEGDVIFAAVAPGNARSIRAFLGVGFTIVGSETIIVRPHSNATSERMPA